MNEGEAWQLYIPIRSMLNKQGRYIPSFDGIEHVVTDIDFMEIKKYLFSGLPCLLRDLAVELYMLNRARQSPHIADGDHETSDHGQPHAV